MTLLCNHKQWCFSCSFSKSSSPDGLREAASRNFLSGRATKRGEGLNGCATMEKYVFFYVRKKVPMATKPRGRGAKDLSGRATKKRTFFFGFPYLKYFFFIKYT